MILRNGQPYNLDTPFVTEDGTQYPYNWYRLATPEERSALGFTEVEDPAPIDERFYFISSDGTVSQKSLDQCKQFLLNQIADIRWSKESSGIIYNNHVFLTDAQSRINYLAALMQAQVDPTYSVIWKARVETDNVMESTASFITLSASDIITITQSGIDYITKCFDNEKTLGEAINSATSLDDLLLIDLQSNWPSRNY